MWGYDGFGYGGIGMGIGMLVFWGLIIAAIVVLARGFGGKSGGSEPRLREKTPLDILGERLPGARSAKRSSRKSGATYRPARRVSVNTQFSCRKKAIAAPSPASYRSLSVR